MTGSVLSGQRWATQPPARLALRLGDNEDRVNTVLRPRPAARLPARAEQRWQRRPSLPPDFPTSSAPVAASAGQSLSPPPPRSSRGTAIRGGTAPPPASRTASAWTTWLVPPLPRQRGGGEEGRAGEGRGERRQGAGTVPEGAGRSGGNGRDEWRKGRNGGNKEGGASEGVPLALAEGGDSSGRGGASGGKALTRVIRSRTWRKGSAAKLQGSGVGGPY